MRVKGFVAEVGVEIGKEREGRRKTKKDKKGEEIQSDRRSVRHESKSMCSWAVRRTYP